MPETEQQDKTLSEIVVKEAVGKGLDSPLRESILEAVEDADGSPSGRSRSLPLVGAIFGVGAALGFLAGRQSTDLEEPSLEDIQEPEIIETVTERTTEPDDEMTTETEAEAEIETEADEDGGSSRLGRLLLAVGVLGGIALLRRRLASDEDDDWEPIEEFEPATSAEMDDDMAVDTTETGPEATETEGDADETDEE